MSDYIQHHGIKGMKWGVRRYQNEDGSLTAEGKKRYSIKDYVELNDARRAGIRQYNQKTRGKKGLGNYIFSSKEARAAGKKFVEEKYGNEAIGRLATYDKIDNGIRVAALALNVWTNVDYYKKYGKIAFLDNPFLF